MALLGVSRVEWIGAALLMACIFLDASSLASGERQQSRSLVGRVAQLENELAGDGTPQEYTFNNARRSRRARASMGGREKKGSRFFARLALADAQYSLNRERRGGAAEKYLSDPDSIDMEKLKEHFLVPDYPCPLEGRFGLWGEGGKWVCLKHRTKRERHPVALSIGSRGDNSFEQDLFKREKAFSHTFDFSLSPEDEARMRSFEFMKFYSVGLAGRAAMEFYERKFPGAKFVDIKELMELAGLNYVDVFKIDCEHCEYQVVDDMAEFYTRETVPFGQIQMELHSIDVAPRALKLIQKLESLGYRMFHAEINGDYWKHYEIALIHESLVDPGRAGGAPPAPLKGKALRAALAGAEEQWNINSAKWDEIARGPKGAIEGMTVKQFMMDQMVPEWSCGVAARVGKWGEGGKWVCLEHRRSSKHPAVISIGSHGDKSFEEDMAERLNAFSHTFDFSLTAKQQQEMEGYTFMKFHSLGLTGTRDATSLKDRFPDATFVDVPGMLESVKQDYIDVLKLDCEGCEHSVVEDMGQLFTRMTVPFGQVLIEIHFLHNVGIQMRLLLTLKKLGYRLFHSEVNPSQMLCWELAFIHERLVRS